MISSADIFPAKATLLKIAPISPISEPAIAEASATNFSVRSKSLPGFIPAATADAATVEASSRPYAVPLTEARAFCIISSTVCASWPKPLSLNCAPSIFIARSNPGFKITSVMALAKLFTPFTIPLSPALIASDAKFAFNTSPNTLAFLPVSSISPLSLFVAFSASFSLFLFSLISLFKDLI